jgi:hypothetical protein
MSVADSPVPRNGHEIKNPISSGYTVSLNDVFRESLRKIEGFLKRDNLIVRCDDLPQISGTRQELKQVFDTLIDIIFDSALQSRLFLHVGCMEIHLEGNEPLTTKHMKRYQIRIQTNINTDKSWKDRHRNALDSCEQSLSRLDGTFSVNPVSNTGCLFTLTVPGKFE